MAFELDQQRCFDLPARSFHVAPEDLDLGVVFHGEHAGTSLGPAAGPQSQLAQNLVLSYLGGGRILELKTVQVNDRLTIPRPCIDATNVGFNVEWSQELRLEQSLAEYIKGWLLLWTLRGAPLGLGHASSSGDFLFDLSVGYDLDGIRSAKVQAFLEGMRNARAQLDALFDAWPEELRAWRPAREAVPNVLSQCVTLSTFHGCPAEQIEKICEHLLVDLGFHVIVKMNPTLLGFDAVTALLHDKLGYRDIRPHRSSFDSDLRWNEALGLVDRLSRVAKQRGLTFGAKFSNTLVVENHKSFFPESERLMYLSGAPLHVLTFELCRRFREVLPEPLPISFSAGVDSRNFPDCVASGFVPVTTCTDLLKPGGYGRLYKYLDNLSARMRARGARTLEQFVLLESGRPKDAESPLALAQASLENHRAAADRVLKDPRYSAAQNSAIPRRLGTKLVLFDCISCDKCIPVCPNDANFAMQVSEELTREIALTDLVFQGGRWTAGEARTFKLSDQHQLANYADFCNECGNCDVFCPEEGGPYIVKPRFFGSREEMERAPEGREGFFVERTEQFDRIVGRHQKSRVSFGVDRRAVRAFFVEDEVEVELALPEFSAVSIQVLSGAAVEGRRVRLDVARALFVLLRGLWQRPP